MRSVFSHSFKVNCPCTCNVISDPNSRQGDDHKIDRIQPGPSFNVLEDDGWYGDEEDAASQDEQQRRGHSDLGLAYLIVFALGGVK